MDQQAVEELATTVATRVAVALNISETVSNQMIEFQQSDRRFKEEIRTELKAIRHMNTTAPAVAMVLAAVSLAISFYLSISLSHFQTQTANDIEALARVVRNGRP